MADWPKVVPHDDGIRPAGLPDECFYCKRKIGEEHAQDCITVQQRVEMEYAFTLVMDMPYRWSLDDMESHRNESSWCASNAIEAIAAYMAENNLGCCCSFFHATALAVVDATPHTAPPRPPQEHATGDFLTKLDLDGLTPRKLFAALRQIPKDEWDSEMRVSTHVGATKFAEHLTVGMDISDNEMSREHVRAGGKPDYLLYMDIT